MKFHLHTLKARMAEQGHPVSWNFISEQTGIRKDTLMNIAGNRIRQVRPEQLDALCSFFKISIDQLITPDRVKLPAKWQFKKSG